MRKKEEMTFQDLTSLGKIQPQARELEEAVLGALMLEKQSYLEVENLLNPEDFYDPVHQVIYQAIVNLSNTRNPVDMLTVANELKRMGELSFIGGPVYISNLTDKVGSSAHISFHAQIIKQKSQARKLISISSDIQKKSFDETQDVNEIIEFFEKSFSEITSNNEGFQSLDMAAAINKAIEKASKTQADRQSGKITAIPTGLYFLDELFSGGWHSPDLIILGARPSMGKTQHALSFAKAAAKAGQDCLFISIEMNATQLVNRYLLEDDRISGYNLRVGQMDMEEWNALDKKAAELWNLPIHIADNHNIRFLNNIKSEARRLHRKGKLKIMIIDYLGLIKTNMKFSNRYLEIGHITGELKSLAKELDIPVILLSQLSRPVKGTAVRLPQLEDLRESGDIEQDADIVLFIHKPEYYKDSIKDIDLDEWRNKGLLIISKYREGSRNDAITFYHDERYKKIFDNKQQNHSYTNDFHNNPF